MIRLLDHLVDLVEDAPPLRWWAFSALLVTTVCVAEWAYLRGWFA